MEAYTINCPECANDKVVKVGEQTGEQRYLCKACKKKFRANGKAQGRWRDAESCSDLPLDVTAS